MLTCEWCWMQVLVIAPFAVLLTTWFLFFKKVRAASVSIYIHVRRQGQLLLLFIYCYFPSIFPLYILIRQVWLDPNAMELSPTMPKVTPFFYA